MQTVATLTSKNEPFALIKARTAVMGIQSIEQQAMLQPRPSAQLGYILPSYATDLYLMMLNKKIPCESKQLLNYHFTIKLKITQRVLFIVNRLLYALPRLALVSYMYFSRFCCCSIFSLEIL